jgi:hypothetical protein
MKIQSPVIASLILQQSLFAQQSYQVLIRTTGNEPVAKGKFEPTSSLLYSQVFFLGVAPLLYCKQHELLHS